MPLRIFKRGDIWHYRGTVAGRRLRGSTTTTDKATAQRIAAEIEARQWKGNLDGPESVLTFAQAAMLYRQAQKQVRFLRPIEDYWKDTPVRNITEGAIQQSALVIHPNAGGATRNRHVIVPTQAIINHAAKMKLCPKISVERFPIVKRERDYATEDWIENFMAVANPHLGALACFMFATGARVSEALDVRWGDIDLSAKLAIIRQTKIGEERKAHLPPRLVVALANIEGDRKPATKVFKYSSYKTAEPQWHATIRRGNLKRLTFHACRHGFATTLLQRGVDVLTVAKLGGWKTAALVLSTYGHARRDATLTDLLFGTPVTQNASSGINIKAL